METDLQFNVQEDLEWQFSLSHTNVRLNMLYIYKVEAAGASISQSLSF